MPVAKYDQSEALELWDLVDRKRFVVLNQEDLTQMFSCLRFSPDGNLIFSAGKVDAGAEGTITVVEVETGRQRSFWKGHRGAVLAVAVSPDGYLLASGGKDRTIRLWETSTGRELARWEGHQSSVNVLTFSPDGRTLASGGADGALKLWDILFIRRELRALGLDW